MSTRDIDRSTINHQSVPKALTFQRQDPVANSILNTSSASITGELWKQARTVVFKQAVEPIIRIILGRLLHKHRDVACRPFGLTFGRDH
jgi:hypothetical protein